MMTANLFEVRLVPNKHTFMKTFRLSVVVWMLLWLAGNGALAAVMPFCKHALGHHDDHTMVMQHDEHDSSEPSGHVDHQGSSQANVQVDGPTGMLGFICDNCDLCHLASSVVPTDNAFHFPPEPNRCFGRGGNLSFKLHYPEQPQHIPVSQLA